MYARLALGIAGLGLVCAVSVLVLDLGRRDPPVRAVGMAVGSLAPLVPLLFKRETRVGASFLHAKFDWVNRGKVDLALRRVQDHWIATCPPQREWSQDEKQDAKKVRVLWAHEKRGIMIRLQDGCRIFIASSHPNRLNRAVATAIRRDRGDL